MQDLSLLTGLSFFTVSAHTQAKGAVCDFRNSPRPHYCMGLVFRGKGVFEFSGGRAEVSPGELIFVPVGSRYRSVWTGEPDAFYVSMHFFFAGRAPFPPDKVVPVQKLCLDDVPAAKEAFLYALQHFAGTIPEQMKTVGIFYDVMADILPRLSYVGGKKKDARIDVAVDYIETHYREKPDVRFLASLCHMSPSHFHACFKAREGVPPVEYRHRVCIRQGILLLLRGGRSMEEIAEELGFESAAYFRRVFRKVTGKSPREYKKTDIEKETGL